MYNLDFIQLIVYMHQGVSIRSNWQVGGLRMIQWHWPRFSDSGGKKQSLGLLAAELHQNPAFGSMCWLLLSVSVVKTWMASRDSKRLWACGLCPAPPWKLQPAVDRQLWLGKVTDGLEVLDCWS